ncbi:MAG TPA: hypothetical protein PKK15_14765 [Kouleothrix sp.]|uniref:hypothetical protein n=1 Tax=Kouleothrix sp. TaxID=2779161 RepID=UPI002BF285AF|nr:hypothetical protein [Kouleothrix sp.]
MHSKQEILEMIEQGIENGRIAPYLAAYIAAELLGIAAHATGYDDRIRIVEPAS